MEKLNTEYRIGYYFNEISKIPHGSFNEEAISDYLINFASMHKLEYFTDDLHNVIIYKPATKGYENHDTLMLQGHMDMVCEKNKDSDHDFDLDPLNIYVEDGMLKADKTTLGADDGVALCYMLAILEDDTLKHPALECVFTVQEEVGLIGAMNLKAEQLHAKRMIGLDSEDETGVTTSSSGGRRVIIKKPITKTTSSKYSYQLMVKGLLGGHSGEVISHERGNANKIMARLFFYLSKDNIDYQLASFEGGLKENAIARECVTTFTSNKDLDTIYNSINQQVLYLQEELAYSDKNIEVELSAIDEINEAVDETTSKDIITMMYLMPNGFLHKSMMMEDLTTVSLNMGVVQMKEDSFNVYYSLRSPMFSYREEMSNQLEIISNTYGATYRISNDYNGWNYDANSTLRKQLIDFVKSSEGIVLKEFATHGGLETGIFKGIIPDLDIVTMGPNMHDIHSPDERLEIDSFLKCYQRLVNFIETL